MSLIGKNPDEIHHFLHGPALEPPENVVPNFDHPHDLSKVFLIICIVSTVVTAAFMVVRFYTRWRLMRRFMAEDVILLAGWITFVAGVNSTVYLAMYYSIGAHQWDIRVWQYVAYLKLFHQGTLLFCITMFLLRLAIIMQVLRHFVPHGTRNFTFWAAHTLIYTNATFWIAVTMMEVFSCQPRAKMWEFYLPGKCIDRHAYLIAAGVMNMISEILLMFLPQRVIWGLKLSTKQKMELSPLFLVGTLTCVCSAVRLWQTIYLWPTEDNSHYVARAVIMWTVPEIACIVVVPCLPSLPQFLRFFRSRSTVPNNQSRRVIRNTNNRDKNMVRTAISDVEYHELVMRTEMTVDSVEREDTGPWVQPPARVHITGGTGVAKEVTPVASSAHYPN